MKFARRVSVASQLTKLTEWRGEIASESLGERARLMLVYEFAFIN
jgi:hypothetical protein